MFKDPVVIMKELTSWLLRIQLTVTWLNLTMPSQTVKNSLKAKKIKFPQINSFLEKQLIKFSCTYWHLSFCKIFKKLLRVDPELWGCAIFGPKISHWYKPLLLLRACTLPPAWGVGGGWCGVKILQVFAGWGEEGCRNFYFGVGFILLEGGVIFLGESHNFEVKIKTA